jgi:hypothetical protein
MPGAARAGTARAGQHIITFVIGLGASASRRSTAALQETRARLHGRSGQESPSRASPNLGPKFASIAVGFPAGLQARSWRRNATHCPGPTRRPALRAGQRLSCESGV